MFVWSNEPWSSKGGVPSLLPGFILSSCLSFRYVSREVSSQLSGYSFSLAFPYRTFSAEHNRQHQSSVLPFTPPQRSSHPLRPFKNSGIATSLSEYLIHLLPKPQECPKDIHYCSRIVYMQTWCSTVMILLDGCR